ncbi:hypothetical protein B4O85_06980 [Pseudomonas azotoformans]|uniref:Uncharacterized protein n=1 Tax=Pseudomonas azotoformans TaxID=47878 RepID=A0A4Q0HZ36_PSEAZ|nr:hypothetical protein B4O85_06980 [Pseudomonas azotoformans]
MSRRTPSGIRNLLVPTLRVGMPHRTLRVRCWDAERPGMRSHAERGNDQQSVGTISSRHWAT